MSVVARTGSADNDVAVITRPGTRSPVTADMLTDDLTNTLSRVPSFRVISRKTARSFEGQAIDIELAALDRARAKAATAEQSPGAIVFSSET